jgi:cytochrome c6
MPSIPSSSGLLQGWRRLLLPLLLVGLVLLCWWPRPAWGIVASGSAAAPDGAALFSSHCAGCHINGGNILRRGKTLQLRALDRNGITGPEAIAAIAEAGLGQMSGYGAVLGPGGAEAVGAWVWEQAQLGWKRPAPPTG